MNKEEFLIIKQEIEKRLESKLTREKVKELNSKINDFSFADVNNAIMIMSEKSYCNWNNFEQLVKLAKESENEQKRFEAQQKRIEEVNKRLQQIANEPSMEELHQENKLDAVEDLKHSKVSLKLLTPVFNEKTQTMEDAPLMHLFKMRYTKESIKKLIEEVKSGEHDLRLEEQAKYWYPKRDAYQMFDTKNTGFFVNLAKDYIKKGYVLCFQKEELKDDFSYYPVSTSYANISLKDAKHYQRRFIGDAKRYGKVYPILVQYV